MAILTGHEGGKRLGIALGLDITKTRSIILKLNVDDAAMLVVEQYVSEDQLEEIETIFKEYYLVSKKPGCEHERFREETNLGDEHRWEMEYEQEG